MTSIHSFSEQEGLGFVRALDENNDVTDDATGRWLLSVDLLVEGGGKVVSLLVGLIIGYHVSRYSIWKNLSGRVHAPKTAVTIKLRFFSFTRR